MNDCCNLYFLSALACSLAKTLSKEELSMLSSDLVVLSDMLANIITQQTVCENKE